MSDQMLLTDMKFIGHHGCTASERVIGQTFIVDAELRFDMSKAGRSDNLGDTVDYVDVFKVIKSLVEGVPLSLIEALAEDIASRLLAEFPRIQSVRITVHKAAPAAIGEFNVAVSITRHAEV